MTDEQKAANIAKYGEPKHDVIADAYRLQTSAGHNFCGFTAIKYLRRFMGNNHKSGNWKDLEKAQDFISRMMEVAKQNADVQDTVQ